MNNTDKLSQQQIREAVAIRASRENFSAYCPVIDSHYQLEWFHEIIANKLQDALERVERGEDVRLMIFMPPRHGKSDIATQKFPSWVLGHHPEWPFIIASYSQELATDFGQGTRDLMDSSNYKGIFETRLRSDTTAKAKWMTDDGGGYTAVGVGGAITGRGFKMGIVDDPFKNREEADSVVTRESVHKWWRSTFYTRQEGSSAIILILTRWHDDDLAGRLLKEQEEAEKLGEDNIDKWEVIKFKAIAETDEPHRKAGDALWPKKFDRNKLMRTKAGLGSYEWSSLYQQNPIDEEHQEFKRDWLRYRTTGEVAGMTTRRYAAIDSALSKNAKSDFTGVVRNWVNESNEWNINARRYRISSKGLVDLIFTLHDEGMETIGIEEGAYLSAVEPFLKDEMEARGIYPNVKTLKHGGIMKETRIRGLIPRYENGKVFHIENTCADLEEEYLRFPKSSHDDVIDALQYMNQLAYPPVIGEEDRVQASMFDVTERVNGQEEPVIIGVSATVPFHYVVGNREGLFYNRVAEGVKDPYAELETLLKRWNKAFVIIDAPGDLLELKSLQSRHKNVYVASFGKELKWDGDNLEVTVPKNETIQQMLDEFRDRRISLHGTIEDWSPVIGEMTSLFRTWEIDKNGERVAVWETSAPQRFLKALLHWRAGIERYGKTAARVVEPEFMTMPTGRFFTDGTI